jgi:hypothetical protein
MYRRVPQLGSVPRRRPHSRAEAVRTRDRPPTGRRAGRCGRARGPVPAGAACSPPWQSLPSTPSTAASTSSRPWGMPRVAASGEPPWPSTGPPSRPAAATGRVCDAVVHPASRPVLVVRGGEESWPPERVVVGHDGSPEASAAARMASLLVRCTGALLTMPDVLPVVLLEAAGDCRAQLEVRRTNSSRRIRAAPRCASPWAALPAPRSSASHADHGPPPLRWGVVASGGCASSCRAASPPGWSTPRRARCSWFRTEAEVDSFAAMILLRTVPSESSRARVDRRQCAPLLHVGGGRSALGATD